MTCLQLKFNPSTSSIHSKQDIASISCLECILDVEGLNFNCITVYKGFQTNTCVCIILTTKQDIALYYILSVYAQASNDKVLSQVIPHSK